MSETSAPPVEKVSALPWGTAPTQAKSWQVSRLNTVSNKYERCSWYNKTTQTADTEWVMAALQHDIIPRCWGAGTYKIQWMGLEKGERKGLGKSAAFKYDGIPQYPLYPNAPGAKVEPPVEAPAPPPPVIRTGPETPADTFERIFTLVGGSYDKVMEVLSRGHAAELERARQHHAQMLEIVASRGTADSQRLEKGLLALAAQVKDMQARQQREEEEGEDEEEEKAKKPQLSEQAMEFVGRMLEKHGADAVEKMAEKVFNK